jgi:uncharacterized protein (TIGR00369 family)
MNVADVLAPIPYLRVHQLAVEPCEGAIKLRMPVHKEVTNHVGIVHAGALFTVAETAAGVAALDVIPGGQAIVLLRGATIRYTRRAEGDVSAVARITTDQASAARAAFDATSRADARVEVTATDPEGQTVFEGTFDYALRPRKP